MRIPMPRSLAISAEDRRLLWHHMRTPTYSFVALLVLLGLIVAMGAFLPVRWSWAIEAGAATAMVLTVLLFSMEVLKEAPLMRVFAGLGFCWVAVLFGITLVDYLTR